MTSVAPESPATRVPGSIVSVIAAVLVGAWKAWVLSPLLPTKQLPRPLAPNVGNTASILEQRERELRSAVEAQRNKVLQANQARDQLAVLNREVESAQSAYDSLMQRFNSANLFKDWFVTQDREVSVAIWRGSGDPNAHIRCENFAAPTA